MTYFDTSYLAKCYLGEPGADKVRALAAAVPAIACCRIGEVELTSVFHRHLREGKISEAEFPVVVEQHLSDLADGIWTWLSVTPELLAESARFFHTLKPSVFLRAADAIHLTCARSNGFREVYSNDRHMLAACEAFGLVGRNIL
jgi:predicted nucleic acid-binding protein